MAILNLEYYTQKDLYSDGDIEEQMLKMAKEGVTCEELSSEQVSFPVIYHFSDLRANILNWYPIKKSDSVLAVSYTHLVGSAVCNDRTLCNPFERLLLENPGNSKQPALLSAD